MKKLILMTSMVIGILLSSNVQGYCGGGAGVCGDCIMVQIRYSLRTEDGGCSPVKWHSICNSGDELSELNQIEIDSYASNPQYCFAMITAPTIHPGSRCMPSLSTSGGSCRVCPGYMPNPFPG